MLRKLIDNFKDNWNRIKCDDVVIVIDELGNKTIGIIKEYTPHSIIIETMTVTRTKFDARKVTMKKFN
jgi:hypothetical protein